MPPQRKKWGKTFERRFLCFHKDSWISFSFGLLDFKFWFFKGTWILVFRTLDVLDWFYKGYGLVLRTLDVLDALSQGLDRFFWTLDWFFYWTLDLLIICSCLLA